MRTRERAHYARSVFPFMKKKHCARCVPIHKKKKKKKTLCLFCVPIHKKKHCARSVFPFIKKKKKKKKKKALFRITALLSLYSVVSHVYPLAALFSNNVNIMEGNGNN